MAKTAKCNQMRVKVIKITEEQEFSSGFRKRELIGLVDGEYPQEYLFEFPNDKGDLLDDILEETYVTVHYNIRSRKFEKDDGTVNYYTTLSGWKIEL